MAAVMRGKHGHGGGLAAHPPPPVDAGMPPGLASTPPGLVALRGFPHDSTSSATGWLFGPRAAAPAVANTAQNAALGVHGTNKKLRCPTCSRPTAGGRGCNWGCPEPTSGLPLGSPVSAGTASRAVEPPSIRVTEAWHPGTTRGLPGVNKPTPAPPSSAAAEARFATLWSAPSIWRDDEREAPTAARSPSEWPSERPWLAVGQGRPNLSRHTAFHTPPPSPPSANRLMTKPGPPQPRAGAAAWVPSVSGPWAPAAVPTAAVESLGLDPRLVEGLVELGISKTMAVQPAVISAVRSGRDVLVSGRAGSGRTTAVGVGLLDKVELARGPQALVISPTKDTAVETQRSIAAAGRFKRVKVHASFGGKSGDRAHIKSRRPQIISATLGRALDNMKMGGPINAAELQTLVVDDCDQMHRKFPTEMSQLLALLPSTCQVILVSAGVGKLTREWAATVLRDPVRIDEASDKDEVIPEPRFAASAYTNTPAIRSLPIPGF